MLKNESMKKQKLNTKCSIIDKSIISSDEITKLESVEKDPKDALKKPHGNKGRIITEETRKKLSLANKGKLRTEETKRKMRLAKTGKPRSEEFVRKQRKIKFKNRRSKPITVGVNFFTSINAVAKFFNISRKTVVYRCNSIYFTGWNFANEDVIKNKIKEEDSV